MAKATAQRKNASEIRGPDQTTAWRCRATAVDEYQSCSAFSRGEEDVDEVKAPARSDNATKLCVDVASVDAENPRKLVMRS